MNSPENDRWHNLISLASPAFAGEDVPPYGFVTGTLAQLRAERRETELMERIGLRALLAALSVLVLTAGLIAGLDYRRSGDLEPGLKSLIQVDDMQLS